MPHMLHFPLTSHKAQEQCRGSEFLRLFWKKY
jgi:hypothetical protein